MNTRRNKRDNRGNSLTAPNDPNEESDIILDNEIVRLISPLSDHSEDNVQTAKNTNEKQTIPSAETAGASGAQEKVSQAERDETVSNMSPSRGHSNSKRAPPSSQPGTSN
jgi:hypothetical protein